MKRRYSQAQQVVRRVPDEAQAPFGLDGVDRDVYAVDRDRALGGREHAGEHVERGGLARSVGSQKAENLSVFYLQREVLHREALSAVVGLGHMIDLNHDGS